MRKIYLTNSSIQTQKLAKVLAKEILKSPKRKKAVVLALVGNLGSGKTTFIQGFAKGLGIKEKINSPTFVIMKRFVNFYHFDCYRTGSSKEILDLGFKKIIADPKNIVAVEWADQIKKIMPKDCLRLKFKFIDQKTREINIC